VPGNDSLNCQSSWGSTPRAPRTGYYMISDTKMRIFEMQCAPTASVASVCETSRHITMRPHRWRDAALLLLLHVSWSTRFAPMLALKGIQRVACPAQAYSEAGPAVPDAQL